MLPNYLDNLATTKLSNDSLDTLKHTQTNSVTAHPDRPQINLPSYKANTNMLFIVEFSPGPMKYATGQYNKKLRFNKRSSPLVAAHIKTDNVNLAVTPCNDLNFQATTHDG